MKLKRINLGELVLSILQDRGIAKAQFAKDLGMKRQNIDKVLFSKTDLRTDLVIQISELLGVNLFDYYSDVVTTAKEEEEVKATLTIEMGQRKSQKAFKLLFGENEIEIIDAL